MEKKLKPLYWLFQYSRKYLWAVALLSVISACIAGSFILLALVSSKILDIATGAAKGSIYVPCMYLVGLILLQACLNVLSSNVRVRVSGKLDIYMKQRLFSVVLKKSCMDAAKLHSGEIMNRFTSDVDIIVGGIVGLIPQVISLTTKLTAGLLVLFRIDSSFTLGILGIGILVCLCSRIYSKKFRYLHKEVQESSGRVRSFIQECIENLLVIKSFSNEEVIREKLDACQQENYQKKVQRNAISNLANTMVYVAFTAGYYAALAWGAFQIAAGALTFGKLTAFLQIIDQVKTPFRNMSGLVPQYYSMIGSAERLMELELLDDEETANIIGEPSVIYNKMKSIVFKNVWFGYDKKNVLEDFSVTIPKGTVTAVIGTSGAGKSTFLKLLLSLIKCDKGCIYLEMADQKLEINAGVRSMFSYVPQGNMILSGTIRENIAFAGKEVSEERIIAAAKVACIWEMIEELPEGLDTVLKERGAGLSEGQIQRIAIARAVLNDAPILLLDECTSALDEETEGKVIQNLKQLKNRTIICISHRPAVVEESELVLHF